MFDFVLVLTTLSAWGFGLWCYPKCIRYTIDLYESNVRGGGGGGNDPIIVDEATASMNGNAMNQTVLCEDIVLIHDDYSDYSLINSNIPVAKLIDS
jgi:hypothetical protein